MSFSNNLGIIAALRDEVQDILDNPFFQWSEDKHGIYRSPLGITLIISHIGKANAAFALGRIINDVGSVMMIGTSGGLGHEKVGSLYLSTEFVEHDMDASGLGFPKGVTPFSGLNDHVISYYFPEIVSQLNSVCDGLGIKLNTGRTMSGDQFMHDPVQIAEKVKQFDVHIVDMESAAVAKICLRHEKSFIALRFISDNADHNAQVSWNENVKSSSIVMNKILQKLFANASVKV